MDIQYNEFGPTMWQYAPFGPMLHVFLLSFVEDDNPWDAIGPFVISNNTVDGMQPAGAAVSGGRAFAHRWPYTGEGTDWTRIAGLTMENNTFTNMSGQPANTVAVRAYATDGLTITDNDFDGLSVVAPTTGVEGNTDVTISGNT